MSVIAGVLSWPMTHTTASLLLFVVSTVCLLCSNTPSSMTVFGIVHHVRDFLLLNRKLQNSIVVSQHICLVRYVPDSYESVFYVYAYVHIVHV